MIIWNGLGFLVFVFAFGAALICNLLFDALWGKGYYSNHKWTISTAMLLAATLSWIVGHYLRKRKARVVIDKETREELLWQPTKHTFFFVPMHFWGVILACIGIVLCLMESLN